MGFFAPLPGGMRDCISRNTHPGLLLDKYVASWDPSAPTGKLSESVQRPTVEGVAKLSQRPPEGFDYSAFKNRRGRMLECLGAVAFTCTTVGPLTLHLARASALENAGICLHPLYGFVYLPGTGLKGMARAYAETVWLPAQSDPVAAWRQIEVVFGWAPGSDLLAPRTPKPWKPSDAPNPDKDESACSGCIIFHDAWPEQWPPLIADILNNHHSSYYKDGEPPGDWDSPVPVYFLAVPAGQTFSFAVSKRRSDVPTDLLALAQRWLAGALVHEGAGAKTATGYGRFKPAAGERPPLQSPARGEFNATLELVTPAFLAGANQHGEEARCHCDLRPATIRGLLRWWWRILHAGHMNAKTLAALEAAIWGDVNGGGAVRLTITPISEVTPLLYDKDFISKHNQLPTPPNKKTTQGLWYHSFGMDDRKKEGGVSRRLQRYFLIPGTRWALHLTARPTAYDQRDEKGNIVQHVAISDPDIPLRQAQAALWLLCHYGGVGSKSRKGFGSLAEPAELIGWDQERCKEVSRQLREHCRLTKQPPSFQGAGSAALEQMLPSPDIPTKWTNYWHVLDHVGAMAQSFAQSYKHDPAKKALGLPRKVQGHGTFKPGRHVKDRHASPVFYHLTKAVDGYIVRVTAFPSSELPNLVASRDFLQKLLEHLKSLVQQINTNSSQGRTAPVNPIGPSSTPTPAKSQPITPAKPAGPTLPKVNERVEAQLLEKKTRKGGWRAKHLKSGIPGPIQNSTVVPADKKAGDIVTLVVKAVTPKEISFAWPS